MVVVGCQQASLGFWVSSGVIGCHQVSSVFMESHWASPGVIGCCQASSSYAENLVKIASELSVLEPIL